MNKSSTTCFTFFKALACLIFLLFTSNAYCQMDYNKRPEFEKANNVWTFSVDSGLDFSSGTPVPITSAMPSTGEATSVCHPVTGRLLFYTDGRKCWNANHQLMPNGDSLVGDKSLTVNANSQEVCVVPFVNDPDRYYIFSVLGHQASTMAPGQLYYSVVDMRLDDGRGDVVVGEKCIPMAENATDSFSTGIIAIPGNNCDFWLMTHLFGRSVFKAYHVTEQGVDLNPVVSEEGTGNLNISGVRTLLGIFVYFTGSYYRATMSVSPDRKFISVTSLDPIATAYLGNIPQLNGVVLCRFDADNGTVSDAIELGQGAIVLSSAFSPDNSKLYFANFDLGGMSTYFTQYNISQYDSLSIASSKIVLDSTHLSLASNLRLYRDTIYIRSSQIDGISTIDRPNVSGAGCNLKLGITGSNEELSLHNEVIYAYPPDTIIGYSLDTLICDQWEEGVILNPSHILEGYKYYWSDDSEDTLLRIHAGGTYRVVYHDGCHFIIDSFNIKGGEIEVPVITVSKFTLGTHITYRTYQWYLDEAVIAGATQRQYQVSENGSYQVKVTDENGCSALSEVYEVQNVSIVADVDANMSVRIFPNPVKDKLYIQAPVPTHVVLSSIEGRILMSEYNKRELRLDHLSKGLYLLRLYGPYGNLIGTEKFVKSE